MTHYFQQTHKNLHRLMKDPAFWKGLKVGDEVCGRRVMHSANKTDCGWPLLNDLMTDEGHGWMVCRAGYEQRPWCGCDEED